MRDQPPAIVTPAIAGKLLMPPSATVAAWKVAAAGVPAPAGSVTDTWVVEVCGS